MRDNKAFASLTSGLLARKGAARPAMRPQGFGQGVAHAEDLGWNDMGHDAARIEGVRLPVSLSGAPMSVPSHADVPPVVHQQDEIAREFPPEPVVAPVAEAAVAPVAEIRGAAAPKKAKREVPAPVRKSRITAATRTTREGGRKAAFTLRLDADRHLRLRLACAVQNRSAQQIVTAALDQLLASLPDVERLATSLPGHAGARGDGIPKGEK
jgi:hypothetical protein